MITAIKLCLHYINFAAWQERKQKKSYSKT